MLSNEQAIKEESVAIVHISNIISKSLNQVLTASSCLLTLHTSDSLRELYMRISMFNCVVPLILFIINSAAVSLKKISPTYVCLRYKSFIVFIIIPRGILYNYI
jgi:hypothetical protein